ncbi:Intersectin-2 [Borealophlyctis nickersoniae]|nr:Intersectin-2 [Borealophlyctis nickersoniae]
MDAEPSNSPGISFQDLTGSAGRLSTASSNRSKHKPARYLPSKSSSLKYHGSFDNLVTAHPSLADVGDKIASRGSATSMRRSASSRDVAMVPSSLSHENGHASMIMPAITTPPAAVAGMASGEISGGGTLMSGSATQLAQSAQTSRTNSMHGCNTGVFPQAPTHPPIMRSRSSYSFGDFGGLLTTSNLLKSARKRSAVGDGSSEGPSGTAAQSGGMATGKPVSPATTATLAPKRAGSLSDEEGFLAEIDGNAQQFRFDYLTLYTSARKSHAYRIYNTYLSKNATLPIRWYPPSSARDLNVRRLLANVKTGLDNPDPALFDDLAFVALELMEDVFEGRVVEEEGVRESAESVAGEVVKQQQLTEEGEGETFVQSAVYQAMRNDLRGTRHLTTIQYARAAERATDMPPGFYDSSDMWEKLLTSLEAMGIDCEGFRGNLAARAKSMSSLDSRKPLNQSDVGEDGLANATTQPPSKDWKRVSSQNPLSFGSGDLSHTFVQYQGGDQQFCEYCFRKLAYDKGSEDPNAAYRCESCGYMCHKNCRNGIHVTCSKTSASLDMELSSEIHSEKIRRITEKMTAIQREVDIEMKIRDGLDKMHRAKNALGSSGGGSTGGGSGSGRSGGASATAPTPTSPPSSSSTTSAGSAKSNKKMSAADVEINSQVERSNKKLDVLKHELQRCRLQLAALTAEAAAAAAAATPGSEAGEETPLETSPSVCDILPTPSSTSDGGEVVKIVSLDSMMKAESTKAFFVTPHQTVKQLIAVALEKFLMPGTEEDYVLSYVSDGDTVPLRYEDVVLRLEINLIETSFQLKAKYDPSSLAVRHNPNSSQKSSASGGGVDPTEMRKQREVLMEICETEVNYAEDLKSIVTMFLRPLSVSAIMPESTLTSIFSNIRDLVDLHAKISRAIADRREELGVRASPSDMTREIVEVFHEHVDFFSIYEEYCGNQHHARRQLNKVRQEPMVAKMLQQCEQNPRLNKLTLADLLVKPMHRITRYPILFKRLLSHIPRPAPSTPGNGPDNSLHNAVNTLINRIEDKVADVNECVRRHEAAYRINILDESLEFNGVVERFKLSTPPRELISEKTFTYHKKNTNGTVEVVVLFFTDLILITRCKRPDQFLIFKPPIPIESCVVLDRPDQGGLKNSFQIIHLNQEIHSLQAISAYDKNTWLSDSENVRSQFSSIQLEWERRCMWRSVYTASIGGSQTAGTGDAGVWRDRVNAVPEMDFDGIMGAVIVGEGGIVASPPASQRLSRKWTNASSASSGSKVKDSDGGVTPPRGGSGTDGKQPTSPPSRTMSWGNLFRTRSNEVVSRQGGSLLSIAGTLQRAGGGLTSPEEVVPEDHGEGLATSPSDAEMEVASSDPSMEGVGSPPPASPRRVQSLNAVWEEGGVGVVGTEIGTLDRSTATSAPPLSSKNKEKADKSKSKKKEKEKEKEKEKYKRKGKKKKQSSFDSGTDGGSETSEGASETLWNADGSDRAASPDKKSGWPAPGKNSFTRSFWAVWSRGGGGENGSRKPTAGVNQVEQAESVPVKDFAGEETFAGSGSLRRTKTLTERRSAMELAGNMSRPSSAEQ